MINSSNASAASASAASKTHQFIHTQSYLHSIFTQSHSLYQQQQQQTHHLQSDSSSDSSHSTTTTNTETTTTTTVSTSSSSSPISSDPISTDPISSIMDLLNQPNEDEKPEMLKSYLSDHHSKLMGLLSSEVDSIVLSILHLHRQDTLNYNQSNPIIKPNTSSLITKLKPHSHLIRSNSTHIHPHSPYQSRRTCPSPRPLNRTQSYHLQSSSLSSSPTQSHLTTLNTPDKLNATASEFKPNQSISSHSSSIRRNLTPSIPSNPIPNSTLWSFSPSPIGTPKFMPAPTSYIQTLEDSIIHHHPTLTQTNNSSHPTSYFNQLHIPSDPWHSTSDHQTVDFIPRHSWNTSDSHSDSIPRDPWNSTDPHSDLIPREPWMRRSDEAEIQSIPREPWNYLVSEERIGEGFHPVLNHSSISLNRDEILKPGKNHINQKDYQIKYSNQAEAEVVEKEEEIEKVKIPLISIENVTDEIQSTKLKASPHHPKMSKTFHKQASLRSSKIDLDISTHQIKVCRFYLQGSCLRSDCKFSHDLSKAICRFWLRGHCLKGESKCDFLHEIPDLMRSKNESESSVHQMKIKKSKPIQTKFKQPSSSSSSSSSSSISSSFSEGSEIKSNETFEDAFPSLIESMSSLNQTKPNSSFKLLTQSELLPKEYLDQVFDEVLPTRSVSQERRDECIEKYQVCLNLNDQIGIQSWLEEIRNWEKKIENEEKEKREEMMKRRHRRLKDLINNRMSLNTMDRMKKGKMMGNGICLGVRNLKEDEKVSNSKERMEVLMDLKGMRLNEIKEMVWKFVSLIRLDGFLGLSYVLLSELDLKDLNHLENWLDESKFKWKMFDDQMICIDPVQ
ncbi:hypothetical protein DFH28DRAFT_923139 [Melampsora americana]|nr:hypothetical protein DFH28DRAFT_923139 [Melampsora americana]